MTSSVKRKDAAEIAVFGGSGFYEFLDEVHHVQVHTPYGAPSAAVAIGVLGERQIAFLPRHGAEHQVPAHGVNYRANLWAMRELGVTRIIGPCAAGSLKPSIEPGHMVILDQLVDRTNGRKDTFFDGPVPGHVSFADPYCPELRDVLTQACASLDLAAHDTGTAVVIQGPRFSTRAESKWFSSSGWDVVNMTQYPEAVLARELGICYAGVALVTDYDVGLEGVNGIEPVEMHRVFAMLKDNVERSRDLLNAALPNVPGTRSCSCASALDSGPLSERSGC